MTETYAAPRNRTVAALYATQEEAQSVVTALVDGGFERGNIDVTNNTDTALAGQPVQEHGFWHAITSMFDSNDDDAHVYGEAVRRGGSLVTVHTADEEADDAIDILESRNPLNLEDSQREWKAEGWSRPAIAPQSTAGRSGEEVIPVVEEQLVVGKREVGRGNVRVRSFVREVPVSEQVTLREENVHVERRSVDRPLTDVDSAAFRDRTIEMTEVNEEAVVGKTARVTEEIVVSKDVADHTETISDTVRKTEVEVDDDRTAGGSTAVRSSPNATK